MDRLALSVYKVRRLARRLLRIVRLALAFPGAYFDRARPILAHVIPTRYCDLACTYCNERSNKKNFVPIDELKRRIDALARMRTVAVAISGGEPMTHPRICSVIRHIRSRGMFAGLLTDGSFLTRRSIAALNKAGLDELQISIDNMVPDKVSQKSWTRLAGKLRLLQRYALFDVRINSVVGGGMAYPMDAFLIFKLARSMGFNS
ncbi:MAG TPA: radical SAM protein, partial [Verrucomicrobiae bacterium]|nr:radical SAM protein [Verrucomicrobiae bacterium]